MIIQKITTSDNNSVFITGYDKETGKIQFRSSRNPGRLQEEKPVIEGEIVYLNMFFFHKSFLDKFIKENQL